jgi:site-specific DNA recombinase
MDVGTEPRATWKRPNVRFAEWSKRSRQACRGAAVKDEMASLETRRIDLLGQFESAPPPIPRLHPNLAELYRQKVMHLAEALNDEPTRAAECIRELIEEIRLVPKRGELEIELYGELAALINLANGHPRSKGTGVQITLVAGTRNHLDLQLNQLLGAVLQA